MDTVVDRFGYSRQSAHPLRSSSLTGRGGYPLKPRRIPEFHCMGFDREPVSPLAQVLRHYPHTESTICRLPAEGIDSVTPNGGREQGKAYGFRIGISRSVGWSRGIGLGPDALIVGGTTSKRTKPRPRWVFHGIDRMWLRYRPIGMIHNHHDEDLIGGTDLWKRRSCRPGPTIS